MHTVYENKEREGQGYSGGTVREVEDKQLNCRFVLSHGSTNTWRGGTYDKLTWIYSASHNHYGSDLPTLCLEGHVKPEDLAACYWEKFAQYATPAEMGAAFRSMFTAGFESGREHVQGEVRATLGL